MIGKPVALIQVPNQRGFTPAAAAQYLGICRNTLTEITDKGQLKAYDFNGRRAYKLEELDRFIDSWPEWKNRQQPDGIAEYQDRIASGEKPVASTKGEFNAIG